jgi:FkbM family methyltransferase
MEFGMKQRILRSIGHQLWLPGRDRILRLFSHPDFQQPEPFEIDFFGLPYTGNLNNFIDWSVFYSGAHAHHELRLLADIADALRRQGKPVNFYDVGANIGHHSLFMSKHADHIFSFEPFTTVRDEMERKLIHAGVIKATIFPVALGNRTETGTFHPPTGANQGTGTLGTDLPDNAATETISVSVVRGDDFFATNNLPPISLLKMDVEGYELNVLEGLQETLKRDRPPMLMEIIEGTITAAGSHKSSDLRDLLYPDHVIFALDNTRSGKYLLKPFPQPNTHESLVLPREMAGLIPATGR